MTERKESTSGIVLAGFVGAMIAILGRLAVGILFPAEEPEIVTDTVVQPKDDSVEPSSKQFQSELTAQDLVEVLGLTIWKARVNDHPETQVTSMKLFSKQAGQVPEQHMSLSFDGPGTIRLSLKRVDGDRIAYSATFNADPATSEGVQQPSSAITGAFVDPIKTHTRGTSTGANIGLPGKIILEDSGRGSAPAEEDSEEDSQAIYLIVE